MNRLHSLIPPAWRTFLADAVESESFDALSAFVTDEMAKHQVFPPENEMFTALKLVSPDTVRVVVLGQDPYHDDGQAHGLAFSVRDGVRFPPSLRNIFKELCADMGCDMPTSGDLTPWAQQGVLLINAVLTVRAHEAASHAKRGWEVFTDAIITRLAQSRNHLIFILWGDYARKKRDLILASGREHRIVESAHPSPLSASRGFLGSRPFSTVNAQLRAWDEPIIHWPLQTEDRLI